MGVVERFEDPSAVGRNDVLSFTTERCPVGSHLSLSPRIDEKA